MPVTLDNKLVIAISSRALFNLDESHELYNTDGVDAYRAHQIEHEHVTLEKGEAYPLVEKLLSLTSPKDNTPLVEVVLTSRNSADTGLRIFKTIEHYRLRITRACFTNGKSPYQYLSAFNADLFLSANQVDVKDALNANIAAATLLPTTLDKNNTTPMIKLAFDGDAVLFSDEAEIIYQEKGLDAFIAHEKHSSDIPLSGGPFKGFLMALHHIQTLFPEDSCPIRTALVTARSAPAHERVIKTFRTWDIRIDEALFLGGLAKGEFLKAFEADLFFDDQKTHCTSATKHVPTGHVPHGVVNKD